MSKVVSFLLVVSVAYVAYFIKFSEYLKPAELLPIPQDGYFGAGKQPKTTDESIRKFSVNVPDEDLDDLRRRLSQARTYDPLEDAAFTYGINTTYLYNVIRPYWTDKFDWRKQEAILNSFNHFKTNIEGLDIHFIRAMPPSKYKMVLPLLLVHGWPGSVFEFYKFIPMLTDPQKHGLPDATFAFEVIAPSIPGYGWSEAPKKQGFDSIPCARMFKKLMNRVGHQRFYTQGGDWGSMITLQVANIYPESVYGHHTNMPVVDQMAHPGLSLKQMIAAFAPQLILPAEDIHKVYPFGEIFTTLLRESGYMHIQATKPDTVGFALNDSPLGLAAYILEKFSTWTHKSNPKFADGNLTEKFTLDELLTNVMIYWTTGTIASSQRFYKETFSSMREPLAQQLSRTPTNVPAGVAMFPQELMLTPRSFLEYKYANILQYTDMPRGGHFAAFEEPKLLARDLFSFVALQLSNRGNSGHKTT